MIINVLRAMSTTTEGVKSLPIKGCSIENPFIYSFDEDSTSHIDTTMAATDTDLDVKSELRQSVRLNKNNENKV